MEPKWTSATRFALDGQGFACSFDPSSDDLLCVRKPRPLVEATLRLLAETRPRTLLELGIASGGSTALLALAARPDRLVACELDRERVGPLDRFLERRRLVDSVECQYGVDQGDRSALAAILDQGFGGDPIHLVIDDASHLLAETRASFEEVFPRIRPGGAYVIEDWSWQSRLQHRVARPATAPAPADTAGVEFAGRSRTDFADYAAASAGKRSLAALALELTLACACASDVVAGVAVDEHWVVVRRGPAPLEPGRFALGDHVTDPGGILGTR
jgi:predicted O-methyltransferase YrrM